jgi:uncharacterized protein (TIGR02284 family)
MTTAADIVKSLHTSIVDTRHGYEEALKDEPESDLAPLFRRMSTLHLAAGDELAKLLEDKGEQSDDDGSIMSTVHRTVMSVRSMITKPQTL